VKVCTPAVAVQNIPDQMHITCEARFVSPVQPLLKAVETFTWIPHSEGERRPVW